MKQQDKEIEIQTTLKFWLWIVYAFGFMSGALTSLGIAHWVGWF